MNKIKNMYLLQDKIYKNKFNKNNYFKDIKVEYN